MGRGRKKLPTEVKKLRGTLKKERVLENEMQVEILKELPETPEWLSDIAKVEWKKVCLELFNKNMLHYVDLKLIEAYCNAIALHIETEMLLRENGRVQVFKNEDGSIKYAQSVPYQKIANDALDKALKISREFGFTPSSRTNISQPTLIQQNNEYNFFD
jgi:P27 family predicted phage terminase small subunit|tara:strand:+ start:1699 stop:2175 length:477 start_codon:yes stop_codon:yes gene_type:complete